MMTSNRPTWTEAGLGSLEEAVVLADGRVVTAGSSGVLLWSADEPRIERELSGRGASRLALSSDEERIAAQVWSTDDDDEFISDLVVWSTRGGRELHRSAPLDRESVWDRLIFVPGGDAVVIAQGRRLALVTLGTGKSERLPDVGPVWSLAAVDGRLVASGPGHVWALDGAGWIDLWTPGGDESPLLSLSPDGARLIAAVGDRVASFSAGVTDHPDTAHLPGRALAVHAGEGNGEAVVAGMGGSLSRWRPSRPLATRRITGGVVFEEAEALAARFSRDGRQLIVYAPFLGWLDRVDVATDRVVTTYGRFGEDTWGVPLIPGRALTVSVVGEAPDIRHTVQLWDSSRGSPIADLVADGRAYPEPAVCETSGRIGVHETPDGVLEFLSVYEPRRGERLAHVGLPRFLNEDPDDDDETFVEELYFEGDGQRLIAELEDGKAVLDVASGTIELEDDPNVGKSSGKR